MDNGQWATTERRAMARRLADAYIEGGTPAVLALLADAERQNCDSALSAAPVGGEGGDDGQKFVEALPPHGVEKHGLAR